MATARASESAREEGEAEELAGRNVIDEETAGAAASGIAPTVPASIDHGGPSVEPLELVARGVSFFTDLSRNIAAPGGAEALVSALCETDPETGKTYLKIPIESSTAAADAISALFGIFSAISAGAKAKPDPHEQPSAGS